MVDLTLDRLLQLENEGWQSLRESRGGDFYGELMTRDAVMVLVDGSVLDRDTIAASLNGSPPWDDVAISDERVVSLGPGAAALVYRAKAVRGDEPPFTALMSSVYCETDDGVRLALYQQTSIPS